jgi:hypothetical protein
MYLTAHLVRSGSGSEGINSFLHRHGTNFGWPEDASAVPEQYPGSIVAKAVSIPPGGNSVRAYLDVLGSDDLRKAEIAQALGALRKDLPERRNPTVFRHGRVTVRFGTELGLGAMREQYLEMLESAAMELLHQNAGPAAKRRP